jgi:NIMA (never in mitosis gene a)-related kinase
MIDKHKKLHKFVPEATVWEMLSNMLKGLLYLHETKIVHRDIKCANVFLGKNNEVKLGDLNVSKIAKYGIMNTQTGTPYYCPPEIWQDKPYNEKCDIWSAGCVIYELCTHKPPFTAKDMNGLHQRVLRGHYPPIPNCYSIHLSRVI